MYSRENVRKQITTMGVTEFKNMISSSEFSKAIAKELEKEGIFIDEAPSLSILYYLAQ